ncbi:MAG: hypothetical protein LAO20_15985 [Acidobacteriia bacterium]|nr:hypothetical protein [Terriglobia bacterium]
MKTTKQAWWIGTSLILVLLSRPGWSLAPAQQQDGSAQKQSEEVKPAETQPQKAEPASPDPTDGVSRSESKSGPAELPSAPVAKTTQSTDEQKSATPTQADAQKPSGTAAAESEKMSGVAASTPTGMAIAPAKQHRRRAFWVKLGAVAGASVALGTTLALSRSTSSKPPGVR